MPDPKRSAEAMATRVRDRARARARVRTTGVVLRRILFSRRIKERLSLSPRSASPRTQQESDVSSHGLFGSSSEVSIASPQMLSHRNSDGSSSTFPTNYENIVEGAADPAYAQATSFPDVSSSDESPRTKQESDVSSHGSCGSSSEVSIASPQMLSHRIIGGSSSTLQINYENIVEGAADPACALATSYPDVSSSDEYSGYSSEESNSPQTVPDNITGRYLPSAPSLGSKILAQHYMNCYQDFYIRMDKRGLFLTYPDVGGPFQSIDEAKQATENFFHELSREAKCKELDEVSHVEGMMHDRKYYYDGPPKTISSSSSKTAYDEMRYLIKALLDQYNDDQNLVGNHAHELEDLLEKQLIYENHRWYYHFNFKTKQKEDDGNPCNANKLFFAEVSHLQGEKAWEVNCCCMIDPQPNGVICHGCKNGGSPSMMHPSNTALYAGGQLDGHLPFGCVMSSGSDEESDFEEEEEEEEEDEELLPWLRWEDRKSLLQLAWD